MKGYVFTYKEKTMIKKYYGVDGPKHLACLIGRSKDSIIMKACRMGVVTKRKYTRPTLKNAAEIIEIFVSEPNIDLKEIAKYYNMSYQRVSAIISKYFKFKGKNYKVLILKSKV